MKKYTLLNTLVALVLITLAGCKDKNTVTIEGVVANANGETLYLEHLAGNPTLVDTLVLGPDGKFAFHPTVERGGPDFFNLRLSTQNIPLITDTLLNTVTVKADMLRFGSDYEVGDETNRRLQQAARMGNELRRNIIDANHKFTNGTISQNEYRDMIQEMVADYKKNILSNYIYENPADPVSYYCLFESVRGLSIFDPYDPTDNRAFGAVATGWIHNYSQSPRVAVLEKVTTDGQQIRRRALMNAQQADSVVNTTLRQSSYFEITLPDEHDRNQSLSQLVDGTDHVVLLDFTAYYLPASATHNLLLKELYRKYQDRGFSIYQVCLDFDENFWKVGADNLPWVTVRDAEVVYDREGNILSSRPASTYNVNMLPMCYLLDREGNLRVRIENDEKLEEELRKLL